MQARVEESKARSKLFCNRFMTLSPSGTNPERNCQLNWKDLMSSPTKIVGRELYKSTK